MKEEKLTEKEMSKYLLERYSDSRQWVFLTQVHASTGGANRIADAMAFNMYASTGYEILGFEIKVSRSDWLHELKDMSKSNEIMSYCDKWYLVVPDSSIVKDGELPKNWGMLVLKDGKLTQKVRALQTRKEPMPDYFIASLLRRSSNEIERIRSEYIKKEDIELEIKKARESGYRDGQGYNGKQAEANLKELREKVIDFEKATGLELNHWRGKEYASTLGAYVKTALGLSDNILNYDLERMGFAVKSIEKAMNDIRKIKTELGKNVVAPLTLSSN